MTEKSLFSPHGIQYKHSRGKVADFLGSKLANGKRFFVVSAYFTIYAHEARTGQREDIDDRPVLLLKPN